MSSVAYWNTWVQGSDDGKAPCCLDRALAQSVLTTPPLQTTLNHLSLKNDDFQYTTTTVASLSRRSHSYTAAQSNRESGSASQPISNTHTHNKMAEGQTPTFKLVLVGDGGTGKVSEQKFGAL